MDAEQSKLSSPTDRSNQEHSSHIVPSIASSNLRPRLVDERPSLSSLAPSAKSDLEKPDIQAPSDRSTRETTPQPPLSFTEDIRAKKRKLEIALGEIDPNLSSPPKKAAKTEPDPSKETSMAMPTKVPSQECAQANVKSSEPHTREIFGKPPLKMASAAAPPLLKKASLAHQTIPPKTKAIISPAPRLSAKPPEPIERPLNIIPLSRLRGYPRRNDIYDVFVVIQAVANEVIKRSRMPAKRDLRIVDPSTDKKVLLSISSIRRNSFLLLAPLLSYAV